jgi:hypothetical protein
MTSFFVLVNNNEEACRRKPVRLSLLATAAGFDLKHLF